jgi:hypothetical protein
MPVQVLQADGTGYDSDVIAGVIWAADNGANVILMGFSSPDYSAALADAIAYASGNGVVLVAATGNDGSTAPSYPAGMANVIGVAATDENDNLASNSNTGSALVAAPGVNIYTTLTGGGYGSVGGTSAASAHVAGLAALLAANGNSNSYIFDQIRSATDLIGQSFGRINVTKALGAAVTPVPTPEVTATPTPGPVPTYVAGDQPTYGVNLTNISALSNTTLAGINSTYYLNLTNNGTSKNDKYDITISNPDVASIAITNFNSIEANNELDPGASYVFTLNVTNTIANAKPFRVNVTATVKGKDSVFAYINTTTTVITAGVNLTNISALSNTTPPGTNSTYYLNLTNNGTATDTYTITTSNPNLATIVGTNITKVTLSSGASQVFTLNVTNTSDGTFRVNVTATSGNDPTKFGYVNTTTTVTYIAGGGAVDAPSITGFAPASPVSDVYGATRRFNITANQTVNVTWYINGTSVQPNTSVTNANYTNTSAAVGFWNVTAIANNTNGTASQTWNWTVNKANTTTALTSSVNPSVFGQSVTFNATVSVVSPGAGTPAGTVEFFNGSTSLGTGSLSGNNASISNSSLGVGSNSITAVYSGDGSFKTNTSSPITQTVNKANTTTALISAVNPSVFGQVVNFTATVTANAPGSGIPGGSVQFKIDGSDFGSLVTLSGSGTATSGDISSLSVTDHTVTAEYSGNSSYNASTGSLTQTVNKANTTTALISAVNPSVFGQVVNFTATVTANAPGSGIPGGSVQFKIDGSDFGSLVTLSGSGTATSGDTSSLSVGNHILTAEYSGDTNFTASTGTLSGGQTVNDKTAPIVSNVVANPNPVAANKTIYINATISDVTTGNSNITSADYSTNGTFGPYVSMNVTDGAFDEPEENVTNYTTLPVGVYNVCVRGTDAAGNVAIPECTLLAVYDPSAGFVTGGGWINSPAGAYVANPSLTGKANFGFVSKYQKGAQVPTGQTEFQFKAGDLNFHSSSYEWLVVSGTRAQYKGVGKINGTGDYGFMLTVIDGNLKNGGGFDKFRIKIWDRATNNIVYDNQLGVDDTADPTTVIGGGSIQIQAK